MEDSKAGESGPAGRWRYKRRCHIMIFRADTKITKLEFFKESTKQESKILL
jgi:hypothetical protein